MTSYPLIPALTAALFVAACAENGTVTSTSNIDPISLASAPPGAAPNTCWGKNVTPAVVETVMRKVLVKPAQISSDGRVQAPPVHRDENQAVVVKSRQVTWFEIPCPALLTPDFVSSLQRALGARDYYHGPVTGELDVLTRDAIESYQAAQGLEQKTLTVAGARSLGLIAVERIPDAT